MVLCRVALCGVVMWVCVPCCEACVVRKVSLCVCVYSVGWWCCCISVKRRWVVLCAHTCVGVASVNARMCVGVDL